LKFRNWLCLNYSNFSRVHILERAIYTATIFHEIKICILSEITTRIIIRKNPETYRVQGHSLKLFYLKSSDIYLAVKILCRNFLDSLNLYLLSHQFCSMVGPYLAILHTTRFSEEWNSWTIRLTWPKADTKYVTGIYRKTGTWMHVFAIKKKYSMCPLNPPEFRVHDYTS